MNSDETNLAPDIPETLIEKKRRRLRETRLALARSAAAGALVHLALAELHVNGPGRGVDDAIAAAVEAFSTDRGGCAYVAVLLAGLWAANQCTREDSVALMASLGKES